MSEKETELFSALTTILDTVNDAIPTALNIADAFGIKGEDAHRCFAYLATAIGMNYCKARGISFEDWQRTAMAAGIMQVAKRQTGETEDG